MAPSGLWQAQGWVRGDVTLGFYGDSPSGVCGLGATINGQIVANSSSLRNYTTWHQCSAPAISQTIHTIAYGQGAMPLTISGLDAAGVAVNYTKVIHIDNQQPTRRAVRSRRCSVNRGDAVCDGDRGGGSVGCRRDLVCGGWRASSVVSGRDG